MASCAFGTPIASYRGHPTVVRNELKDSRLKIEREKSEKSCPFIAVSIAVAAR
jgi:hypothetical protein